MNKNEQDYLRIQKISDLFEYETRWSGQMLN